MDALLLQLYCSLWAAVDSYLTCVTFHWVYQSL